MPKTNKVTSRVFADIAKTQGDSEAVENFLNIDKELGIKESETLTAMKNQYKKLSKNTEFTENLNDIAIVEEIIVQLRSRMVIDSELRLSLSRNYIYARSLFYRRGKDINDIRVIVGVTEDWGDDITTLINDDNFRSICKSKIIEAMDKEINKNIEKITLSYEKIKSY